MNAVPELPSADRFGQPCAVKSATTSPLYGKADSGNLCACGCKQRHGLAVSKVITEDDHHGPARRVLWFATWHCKTTWEARNVRE